MINGNVRFFDYMVWNRMDILHFHNLEKWKAKIWQITDTKKDVLYLENEFTYSHARGAEEYFFLMGLVSS